ncbi:MAG TPA: hypothetical protein EYH30_07680, partial [Anaerolineales bacterium]|nr:hypothetical protein [Anaerolineales bacterium]
MTGRSSRGKKKKSGRRRRQRRAPRIQLSLDVQLDILGYALLGVATLTLLALLSVQRGALLGPWVALLSRAFGWGVYAVPFFVGAAGLYLVLRRFGDRIPRPRPEQVAGVLFLFVAFLITIHFPVVWGTGLDPRAAADAGYGGGHVGAGLGTLLVRGLGGVGAALVLLMLWLLGIFFTSDLSPADMVRGLTALVQRLQFQRRPARLPPAVRAGKPTPQR